RPDAIGERARLTSGCPGRLRDSGPVWASLAPCLLIGSLSEFDSKRIDFSNAPSGGAPARSARPIEYREMSARPHEGPAEEGLSSSLLQIVHDPERVDRLRTALSVFCHRCRNSLNGIKMSLYLFRREARGAVPDSCVDLEAIYQQIVNLFDHLQSIYRPMAI